MNTDTQLQKCAITQVRGSERPRHVVGMDAHSRKLAIAIMEWEDPWYPKVYRKIPNFKIEDLETTYKHNVPLDSITIIEASTNSFHIKERLNALGYQAEVVKSDVIAGKLEKRKICDSKDAEMIARTYIGGNISEFVWSPTPEIAQYRELLFAYRDCKKDLTRIRNRIWSLCSQNGHLGQLGNRNTSIETIRERFEKIEMDSTTRFRFNILFEDYERYEKRSDDLKDRMAKCVIHDDTMLALMQLPGVGYRTAFATVACVGDVRRFSTSAKFAAYAALAPSLNTSGEEEERAKRKGGSGKPLDNDGRHDLKFYYVEAAKAVLQSYKGTALGKWGWHLINSGKSKNEAVCAVARKLATYAWHVLRGDPTPNRECEESYKRKLKLFYGRLHLEDALKELGYQNRQEFAEKQAERIFGNLPNAPTSEM